MAIQNDNTFLSKGDLKAYHEKILPYLGGNFMMSTNVATYYDENEKIIGIYNGKPLYQKTFTGTAPECTIDGTEVSIGGLPLGFRLDTLVDAQCIITNTTGITRPLPNLKYENNNNKLKLVRYWVYTDSATDTAQKNTYGFVNSWTQESGGTIKLTMRYTKTTDAAGSATATPGAYDINFPNMWPENKEIYFGNGLYGKRYTGTYTGQNTTFEVMLDTNLKKADISSIVNHGGSVNRAGGGATQTVNWNNTATMHNMAISTNGVYLQIKENNTTAGHKYDVWMTYTK